MSKNYDEMDLGFTAEDEDENDGGIDLDGVESPKFTAIKPGVYDAVIISLEQNKGQTSGEKYWRLRFELQSEPYEGMKVSDILSWAPNAAPYSKRTLEQLTGQELKGKITVEQFEGLLVDTPVRLKIRAGRRQDTGDPTNDVERIFAATASDGAPHDKSSSSSTPAPATSRPQKANKLF